MKKSERYLIAKEIFNGVVNATLRNRGIIAYVAIYLFGIRYVPAFNELIAPELRGMALAGFIYTLTYAVFAFIAYTLIYNLQDVFEGVFGQLNKTVGKDRAYKNFIERKYYPDDYVTSWEKYEMRLRRLVESGTYSNEREWLEWVIEKANRDVNSYPLESLQQGVSAVDYDSLAEFSNGDNRYVNGSWQ